MFLKRLKNMIDIVGSKYCYQGEQLASPEIIVVRDHHYNEEQQCFPVKKLLENSTCNSKEHVVIFDHVLQHDDALKDYHLVSFPSFLARENTEFVQQHIQPDWSNKTAIFNFMINKPRPHRIELLEMIKEFNLTDYCHSLAWQTNTVNNIPVTDYRFGSEIVMERGIRNGSFCNAHTYQGLLQKTVFEPTCISLITEPVYYERETIVTEKTLMAMWAGTIPVWVGGWRIPDYLTQAGFDTFNDFVDHSYQNLANPKDRSQQAVERNLHVLTNFEKTKQFVQQNQSRLHHNLRLLESNFFKQECLRIIDTCCGDVRYTFEQMIG
jgi:hypothetical protein